MFYLKSIFGKDIRAIVPQIAMSAGTMIALSCKEIVMGKESNLGPIDPQFNGISCGGILEEFERAIRDIQQKPASAILWQTLISKYHPAFLGDCEKAIEWSNNMVTEWLKDNMFFKKKDKDELARHVVEALGSHSKTYSHGKHIHMEELRKLGLKIISLEKLKTKEPPSACKDLQDCVLTIHHAYMHTFSNSLAVKIVENHKGQGMFINAVPASGGQYGR